MEYKATRKMTYGNRTYETNQIVPIDSEDKEALLKYKVVKEIKTKRTSKAKESDKK